MRGSFRPAALLCVFAAGAWTAWACTGENPEFEGNGQNDGGTSSGASSGTSSGGTSSGASSGGSSGGSSGTSSSGSSGIPADGGAGDCGPGPDPTPGIVQCTGNANPCPAGQACCTKTGACQDSGSTCGFGTPIECESPADCPDSTKKACCGIVADLDGSTCPATGKGSTTGMHCAAQCGTTFEKETFCAGQEACNFGKCTPVDLEVNVNNTTKIIRVGVCL